MVGDISCTVYQRYEVAPTLWAIPGGWLNVQRRADPLTDDQWLTLLDDEFIIDAGLDFKRDNFGSLAGQIVIIDFGELT